MAYEIIINNEKYKVRDGINYKEEYNEQLDSATLKIDVYGKELDIQPFDNVVIYDSNNKINKLYLKVDSFVDEIFNFKNPLKNSDRTYTISLVSETKALERVTMPNLSTTQRINTTEKISVWTQIERIFNHYIPKIKVVDVENKLIKYVNSVSIDSNVKTKFENIECPEFQWNNPNLKEVLVDLFSTADCLPVVKNNILSYFDITKRGKNIDTTKLTNMESSMNSSDYSGELTIYMKNSIGKELTSQIRYRTLKAPDGSATITTDNAILTTEKPIYSIKKLVIYGYDNGRRLHKADVTDRVIEYDEWNILSSSLISSTIYDNLPSYTDKNGLTTKKHKCAFLYYKRGGNSIENFGTRYKTVANTSQNFMSMIFVNSLINIWEENKSDLTDPRKIFVELEYESVSEHALNAGKYLASKHPENRLFDNQSESYVDVAHLSIFEYAKINRLGNKIITIYGEYNNYSDIPNLSDVIDNNILFSREITFYDNIFYFKGMMTENYILKDYFTGVNAKKRSWQISSAEDALKRQEIFKFYVEGSFKRKNDLLDDNIVNWTGHGGIMSDIGSLKCKVSPTSGYFDKFDGSKLSHISIMTRYGNNIYPVNDKIYQIALDTNVEIQGNSLCFNFGFNDNYKSADYSYKDQDANEYIQDFYAYANEYGNFDKLSLYLSYTLPDDFYGPDENGELIEIFLPTAQEDGGTKDDVSSIPYRNAILATCGEKPLVKITTWSSRDAIGAFMFNYDFYKDTREIFAGTLQFEYCSDNENIIITPEFIKNVRATRTDNNIDGKYLVWFSPDSSKKYNVSTSNKIKAFGFSSSRFDSKISIEFPNEYCVIIEYIDINIINSWAISDLDGNVLLAVNGRNAKKVYINLLKSRDCNVYNNNIDQKIIGTISDDIDTLIENAGTNPPEITKVPIESDRFVDILDQNAIIK